jgi:hypothetical protein
MRMVALLFVTMILVSCGKDLANTSDGQIDNRCACLPTTIKLKTLDGHELVNYNDLTSLVVTIYATSNGSPETSREFTGNAIFPIVSDLALYSPREDGAPASVKTGEIVIRYKLDASSIEKTRTLSIQNRQIIEDETFPNVTYRALGLLDLAWLERQDSP